MGVRNPDRVDILDEGVDQGRVSAINFVGTAVVAAVSGKTATVTVTGGSGTFALTTVEINLGAAPNAARSGHFQITGLTGLTIGEAVLVHQANGPYTGKGTRQDEAEMDIVLITGKALDANTIQCYWKSQHRVRGNIKFNYVAG